MFGRAFVLRRLSAQTTWPMGQTVRRLTSEVVAEATTSTTSATAAAGKRGSVYLPWGLSAFVLSFSALAGTGWAIKLASDEKEQREAEQLGLPARSLDPLSPTALTVPGLLGTSFQLSLAPSLAAARRSLQTVPAGEIRRSRDMKGGTHSRVGKTGKYRIIHIFLFQVSGNYGWKFGVIAVVDNLKKLFLSPGST